MLGGLGDDLTDVYHLTIYVYQTDVIHFSPFSYRNPVFIPVFIIGERESEQMVWIVFTLISTAVIKKESQEAEVVLKMEDRKSCDLCPKNFAGSGSLYNHRKTHSRDKKYNCSQCNKSFGTAGEGLFINDVIIFGGYRDPPPSPSSSAEPHDKAHWGKAFQVQ